METAREELKRLRSEAKSSERKELERLRLAQTSSHKPKQVGPLADISPRDLARSYAQGGAFGGQDEIQAALGAGADWALNDVPYLENYRGLRDIERQDQAKFAEAHPVINVATQMAGGMALPGASGLKLAEKSGRALPLIGAGEGALAGLGYSEEETLGGMAKDAAIGAAGGGAFSWATPKIINAGRNLATGVGRMGKDIASDAGDAAARRAIEKAMQRDGMTLEEALAALKRQGPEAMLADLGPNMKALGRVTTSQPGPSLSRAVRNLDERAAGRQSRLVGDLEESAQHSVNDFTSTLKATSKIRKDEGAALFKEAFDQALEPTDELMRISKSGIMQDAMKKVQGRVARADKESGGTLQMLHRVKKQLWDDASALKRAGRFEEAADIDDIRRRMVAELDKSNSTYKKARNLWAGTKEIDDAAQYGRTLFTGKKHVDEVEDALRSMTDTEVEAFQMGAVRSVFDFLEESGDIGRVRQLLRKPRYQKLLGKVFPDEASEGQFLERLITEQNWQSTSNKALGGSPTADILAGQKDAGFRTGVANAAAESAVTGNLPFASILRPIAKSLGPNISDETLEVMGKALFGDMSSKQLEKLLKRSAITRISPKPGALSNAAGLASSVVGPAALTEAMQ